MLGDLLQESGADNAPGVVLIYAAEKADILTWPTMPSTITTNADNVASSGNITFKTGKKFEKIEITAGQVTLDEKTSGGPRQNSPMSTLKGKRAGISADAIGWMKINKNKELVVLVRDRNGLTRMLGDTNQGAFITEIDTKTGAKQGDERGIEFTIEYYGLEAIVYGGTVSLTPAS
jgi:hypothetical protein